MISFRFFYVRCGAHPTTTNYEFLTVHSAVDLQHLAGDIGRFG